MKIALVSLSGVTIRSPRSQRKLRRTQMTQGRHLASRPNPTQRLPLLRSLRPQPKTLDHRWPQRHRHLPRRRQKLDTPKTQPARPTRRRQKLERPLASLRRRPTRTHRPTPPHHPKIKFVFICAIRGQLHCCGGVDGGVVGAGGPVDPGEVPNPLGVFPNPLGAVPEPGVLPNPDEFPAADPNPEAPPPNSDPFAYNCSIRGS